MHHTTKVIVIGGGFAGLRAAHAAARQGYEVTLIDRHPYTTFQPLLYQVATGGLNPGDVTYPLRRFASRDRSQRTRFRRATVIGIDKTNQQVLLDHGEPVPYDYLVVAIGVGANYFDLPGVAEHTRTIYTRRSALEVRDIIYSGLERMTAETDPNRRFTVVVVGAGPTGVEMAGTLAEMKTQALPVLYPEMSIDHFHVVLVEMTDSVLGPFDKSLQRYTLHELRKRGVDVRLGTAVRSMTADEVTFNDGSTLRTDLVVWASGVGAHPLVASLGFPQGRGGRIEVGRDLRVIGESNIFAAGDCAIVVDDPHPQLAQPAIQQGEHIARQIHALVNDTPLADFEYYDKGTMATIGRNSAVVQLAKPRIKLIGVLAWLTWVAVHLSSLLGGRNRLQAMINMTVRYFSWPQSGAGIVGDIAPAPSQNSSHDDTPTTTSHP